MYKIELEQFSGPLDLLLQLIEGQKLDISSVALADVTDQYLAYLDAHPNIPAQDLADFLVIATKLLVIKSRTLLPQVEEDEDDMAGDLELQLKMYKEYLDASKKIEKIISEKHFCFTRERVAYNFEPSFSPPENVSVDNLRDVYLEIIKRVDYVVNLPQRVMERVVSLSEMVTHIRQKLTEFQKTDFRSMITHATCKADVVVCFMALLELIKSGEAIVDQGSIFDEITIEKIN
ncbi:MAG: ScpA family protein [Patescibacteria group bacterium]|jgi:segregation and condensation protein A